MPIVVTDSLVRLELVLLTTVYPTPTALPRKLASLELVSKDAQRQTTAISTSSASLACVKLFVPPTQTAPLVKLANLACVLLPHVPPTASVLPARLVKPAFVSLQILPRAPPTASVLPARPVKPVFALLLILRRAPTVASVAPVRPVRTGLVLMHAQPTPSAAMASPVLTEVALPPPSVLPTPSVAPVRFVLLEPASQSVELTQAAPLAKSAKAEFALLARVRQTANATPTRFVRMDLVLPTPAPPMTSARLDESARAEAALSLLNVPPTLNVLPARSVRITAVSFPATTPPAAKQARLAQAESALSTSPVYLTTNVPRMRLASKEPALPIPVPPMVTVVRDKPARANSVPWAASPTTTAMLARLAIPASVPRPDVPAALTVTRESRVFLIGAPQRLALRAVSVQQARPVFQAFALHLAAHLIPSVLAARTALAESVPLVTSARLAPNATPVRAVSPEAVRPLTAQLPLSVLVVRTVLLASVLQLDARRTAIVLQERVVLPLSARLVSLALSIQTVATARPARTESASLGLQLAQPAATAALARAAYLELARLIPRGVRLVPNAAQTRAVCLESARHPTVPLIATVHLPKPVRLEFVPLGLQRTVNPVLTATLERVACQELAHPIPRDVQPAPTAALVRAVYLGFARRPTAPLIATVHLLRPVRPESVLPVLQLTANPAATVITARAVYPGLAHPIPRDAQLAPTAALARAAYLGSAHHLTAPLIATVLLPRPARPGSAQLGLQLVANPALIATAARAACPGLVRLIQQAAQLAVSVLQARVVSLEFALHLAALRIASVLAVKPALAESAQLALQNVPWTPIATLALERLVYLAVAQLHRPVPMILTAELDSLASPVVA